MTSLDPTKSVPIPEKRRRWRWIHEAPAYLTPAHEEAFLTMRLRKMDRQLHGPRQKESKWHIILFVILLVILYGAGTADDYTDGSANSSGQPRTITLTYQQITLIGVWFLVFIIVGGFLGNSRYGLLLNWMVLYLPLLAILASIIFTGRMGSSWAMWALLAAEILAVFVFVAVEIIYPKLIGSKWLRENFGIGKFWSIRLVSDWTMTYAGRYGKLSEVHTCKYDGETNDHGVPHGSGRWLDDSYDGEILTGQWEEGRPVAPFISRKYGTGDAFSAVRIAYFVATDDEFDTTKLRPSNDKPPRCGVASVECSVYGRFYSHLPVATELVGPYNVGSEKGSVDAMCQQLLHLETEEDEQQTYVGVSASDPRGTQVLGHVYAPTGAPFSTEPEQIIVDVHRANGASSSAESKFMPRSSGSIKDEHVLTLVSDEVNDLKSEEVRLVTSEEHAIDAPQDDEPKDYKDSRAKNGKTNVASLTVQNWIRHHQLEALVFFPGFNSSLKHSLEAFGQFMAMTKLTKHVYPICYAWPCGQLLTYRNASAASATQRNRENVLELFRGLSAAGIRNVHLMTHSMGVQSLLASFEDKDDVGSRSDVSSLFRLDSAFDGDTVRPKDDNELLVCKSISLLNPDFPLEAFVDRAFLSIRRVCSHITVAGDRKDVALQLGSKLINGVCNSLGYQQPPALSKRGKGNRKGGRYQVVGCDFEKLYVPERETGALDEDMEGGEQISLVDDALLFKEVPPVVLSPDEEVQERRWLDLDAIDMTSLDTNIAGIRHGGFNMNPILLKDLEELIITGRRASKRSTLLYRDGNIFSYCHAPSHVAM